ncbi:MAG: tRNA pseudouridine(54/55) synthase Pus10 [Promethearchaeota archaeon]
MTIIFDKVLEIYRKYYICSHCLGRMFSLLGTNTTNLERGTSLLISITMENHGKYLSENKDYEKEAIKNLKILAENANFLPAQKVLEKEGIEFFNLNSNKMCYLCHNIFLNLQKYVDKAEKLTKDIEFDNFLIGTRPNSKIVNQEDNLKAELNILDSESFKSHFNREVGKMFSAEIKKPAKFNNPDIVLTYLISFNSFKVDLNIRSLFIFGRYNKLIRGIPQTRWPCKKCFGKGCEICNFSGKKYKTSVEELISSEFIKEAHATDSKFHGAGREDIDVRMLGTGRPFIIELRNPITRNLNLNKILKKVNKSNKKKVKVCDLKYTNKKEVINIKTEAENTKKTYKALVESEKKIDFKKFKLLNNELKLRLENQKISQRTPIRVSHRRTDLIREKFIFKIDGEYLKPNLFEFKIETQGGTYVKELINGDGGRTFPSFVAIFDCSLICKELDVIEIKY